MAALSGLGCRQSRHVWPRWPPWIQRTRRRSFGLRPRHRPSPGEETLLRHAPASPPISGRVAPAFKRKERARGSRLPPSETSRITPVCGPYRALLLCVRPPFPHLPRSHPSFLFFLVQNKMGRGMESNPGRALALLGRGRGRWRSTIRDLRHMRVGGWIHEIWPVGLG